MHPIPLPSRGHAAVRSSRQSGATRHFFPAAALLLLALTAIGFGPFFTKGIAYPGRPIAPPLQTLVLVHAIVMSAWMILLAAQPVLILVRKIRVHMMLGRVGAVIAVLVVASGLWLAIRSVQVTPSDARIWGLPALQFFIVPFTAVVFFGGFVALGIVYRKKPTVHRVMMLLGTMATMSAPVSRIDLLNGLYVGTVWERLFGPFFVTMVLVALLVVTHAALTRKLDRVFAGGALVLIAASLGVWQLAPTDIWARFASMFV